MPCSFKSVGKDEQERAGLNRRELQPAERRAEKGEDEEELGQTMKEFQGSETGTVCDTAPGFSHSVETLGHSYTSTSINTGTVMSTQCYQLDHQHSCFGLVSCSPEEVDRGTWALV